MSQMMLEQLHFILLSGKSKCDQSASLIKHHVRRSTAVDKDAVTPQQFIECQTRLDGTVNTWHFLGNLKDLTDPKDKKKKKGKKKKDQEIPGITNLNHFEFRHEGILVRKHSKIGAGFLIPAIKAKRQAEFKCVQYPLNREGPNKEGPLRRKNLPYKAVNDTAEDDVDADEAADEYVSEEQDCRFKCTHELCSEHFKSWKKFQEHKNGHNHVMRKNRKHSLTPHMTAKKLYIGKFGSEMYTKLSKKEKRSYITHIQTLKNVKARQEIKRKQMANPHTYGQGWALKKRKQGTPWTKDEIAYGHSLFMQGERTGSKVHPEVAHELMKDAKDPNDPSGVKYRFKRPWKSISQWRSFFGKLNAEKNKQGQDSLEATEATEAEIEEAQVDTHREMQAEAVQNIRETMDQIENQAPVLQDHPIMVERSGKKKDVVCALVLDYANAEDLKDFLGHNVCKLANLNRIMGKLTGKNNYTRKKKALDDMKKFVEDNCVCNAKMLEQPSKY